MAVACKISNTVCTCHHGTRPCPAGEAKWAAFITSPKGRLLKQKIAELAQSVKDNK